MNKTYKLLVLQFLLLLEGISITRLLLEFAKTQQFFNPPFKTILLIGGVVLLSLYTYSFIIATWEHSLNYYLTPIIFSISIAIMFVSLSYVYALIAFLLSLAVALYDTQYSIELSKHLIKFEPKYILRLSTKGILFIFSILAAITVLVNPLHPDKIHISQDIAQIAQTQFDAVLKGSPDLQTLQGFGDINIDVAGTVQQQVDKFLTPYKQFLMPLLAILIFGVMQFINSLVYLIFSLTITPIFSFSKKIHFLNSELSTVEKEILKL